MEKIKWLNVLGVGGLIVAVVGTILVMAFAIGSRYTYDQHRIQWGEACVADGGFVDWKKNWCLDSDQKIIDQFTEKF